MISEIIITFILLLQQVEQRQMVLVVMKNLRIFLIETGITCF